MVGGQSNGSSSSGGNNANGSNANGLSSMPPPNSNSSRPPCYNAAAPPPQLSYTPDPTIYYNLPFYGAPFDASGAIYPSVTSEGLELANGGYSEVSPILVSDYLSGFVDGIETTQRSYSLSESTLELEISDVEPSNQQPPPPPETTPLSQSSVSKQPSGSYEKTLSPSHSSQEAPTETPDTTRQTKTPVVSLLSMEQIQEKDLFAMQGGRRVKPQPPQYQQQPPQSLQSSVPPLSLPQMIMQPHFSLHHNPPPPLPPQSHQSPFYACNYNGAPIRSQMHYNKTGNLNNNNNNYNNRDGHFNNGWRKPRNYNNSRKYDQNNKNFDLPSSSRSSLRTDSNSSANTIVDETKNEEKIGMQPVVFNHHRTGGLPPPAPLPLMHPGMMHHPAPLQNNYPLFNGGSSRTYQNSNNNYYQRRNNNNNNSFKHQSQQSVPLSIPNRDFNNDNSSYNKNKNNLVQSTQMRSNNGPPTFGMITSTKRNKRVVRRNTQTGAGGVGGGAPSEIGAGDGPLSNNDLVADTCKKMETLKM